jgi:hypothetical protein
MPESGQSRQNLGWPDSDESGRIPGKIPDSGQNGRTLAYWLETARTIGIQPIG